MTLVILNRVFKVDYSWALIYFMAIFCIFLPYAYLKNTSDNKERIIEYGWKNILSNIVGKSKKPRECNGNSSKNCVQDINKPITREETRVRPENKIVSNTRKVNDTTERDTSCQNMRNDTNIPKGKIRKLKNHDNSILSVKRLGHEPKRNKWLPTVLCAIEKGIEDKKVYRKQFTGDCKSNVSLQKDISLVDLELEGDKIFNYNENSSYICQKSNSDMAKNLTT